MARRVPLATLTAKGTPSGSANPLIGYHAWYAIVLVVLAAFSAGATWEMGRW